jgi:putative ABC transport system permease protein
MDDKKTALDGNVTPVNANKSAAKVDVALALSHIKKDYFVDDKPFTALKDITLAFPSRGFVAILGPSGCGKTTLLNIIGGLDHYTSGDLLIEGKSTKEFTDREWDGYRNERVGFVFQSYNLIPHENVLQNVEVSLLLNGVSKQERTERALVALKSVGLEESAKKRPNQLSGGQMQRIALARAVINNPKIVLADEPTGALDSGTSLQVMEMLKEIAQDRLVIMVTHNRDLADQFAERIIEMKDGVIVKDSAPLKVDNLTPTGKEISKKTAMSFMTALRSSFLSIGTKKARTILTAVASSIGIIGVALVLAVSNGFTNYVDNVEGSVASSVPITISPVDYSYLPADSGNFVEYPSDDKIHVYDTSSSAYVVHRNNYTQDYFNYVQKTVDKGWARSIMFNRIGLNFHLLTQDGSLVDDAGKPSIKTVEQYSTVNSTSGAVGSATGLPSTIFHELYGEEKGLSSMYDVIYGKFPQKANEIVLITDRYNRIEFSTLQRLHIIDSTMTATAGITYNFADLVYDGDGDTAYKTYKAYRQSDYYQMKDSAGNDTVKSKDYWAWNIKNITIPATAKTVDDIQIDATAVKKTIHYYEQKTSNTDIYANDATYNPIDLKIVGVLRPSQSSYISLMPSSIGYLSSLKDTLVKDTESGQPGEKIAQYAADNYYINNHDENAKDASTNDMNPEDGIVALKKQLAASVSAITGSNTASSLSESTISSLLTSAYTFRFFSLWDNASSPYLTNFSSFLTLNRYVGGDFKEAEISGIPDTPSTAYSADDATWARFMAFWRGQLMDPNFYNQGTADWNAIDFLAYFNGYALVSSVLIFPASLTTKDALHAYLDDYNTNKNKEDQILYSDIMSTFTSSLGILIQVISVVLIVFAAISLVVSSVMTGIITYVSVVERTKEIGILRACGARKKDVGRLFEAECTIIGFSAGLIGVAFTYLACIPINLILDHQFPGNNLTNIASLNPWHALILVALGVLLALISGLIPSRIAAKKDPVVALRTE